MKIYQGKILDQRIYIFEYIFIYICIHTYVRIFSSFQIIKILNPLDVFSSNPSTPQCRDVGGFQGGLERDRGRDNVITLLGGIKR